MKGQKMKSAVVYFSKNELFCLHVAYGISSLKKVNENKVSSFFIEDDNLEKYTSMIIGLQPDMIIIFVSFHCYELLKRCSSALKKNLPMTKIVICHSVASSLAHKILTDIKSIDIAIIGEFENVLTDLCICMSEKKNYYQCHGIAYYKNDNFIINKPKSINDISNLSYPDRDSFEHNSRYFHVLGSRGCERNCAFCDRNYLWKITGNVKQCFRSIDDIVTEIDYLVDQYNCKMINFYDSTFCSNTNIKERLEELYKALISKKYWVQFSICLRAEQIDEDVAQILKKLKIVGLGKVFLGIESFNKNDLKNYNKSSSVMQNNNALRILNNTNIFQNEYYLKVGCGFINFNPYTTKETLKQNVNGLIRNAIPLDPYILTSRVSLNYMTKMTERVDYENLFKVEIKKCTLPQLMTRRFPYNFLNLEVQEIYDLLMLCKRRLEYRNITGAEFIRNRYLHFFGCDKSLDEYNSAYQKRIKEVDLFSRMIFNQICEDKTDFISKKEKVITMTDQFKPEFSKLNNKFQCAKRSIAIKLMKIDELIYNKI